MNRDLNLTEEVQHYKQTLAVKSLSEVRRALPQMWLQKKSPNMQKVMMIEKPSLSKNWRVTPKDSYKKETKKEGKNGTWREEILLQREKEREILGAWEKKLSNPEIKGITNFYSSSKRRKLTNSSYRDLLTT